MLYSEKHKYMPPKKMRHFSRVVLGINYLGSFLSEKTIAGYHLNKMAQKTVLIPLNNQFSIVWGNDYKKCSNCKLTQAQQVEFFNIIDANENHFLSDDEKKNLFVNFFAKHFPV